MNQEHNKKKPAANKRHGNLISIPIGENLALMRESSRRDPSMKAMSATFPSLLPSALDRFRFDFMASLSSLPSLSCLHQAGCFSLARVEVARKKYIRRLGKWRRCAAARTQ